MFFTIGMYLQKQINSGYLRFLLRLLPYRKQLGLVVFLLVYLSFTYIDNFYIKNMITYLGFLIISVFLLLNFKDFDTLLKKFRIFNYYSLIFMILFHIVFIVNLFE